MTKGGQERFVPSGVDAQSWLGFEQRIQERRFRALLDTMDAAIAEGDPDSARAALREARELRPDAPELAEMEERLFDLPAVGDRNTAFLGSRAIGAVLLLVVGVALFVGLEWLRQPATLPLAAPAVAAPGLTATAPPTEGAQISQAPVTIVSPPTADQLVPETSPGTAGADQQARSRLDQSRLRAASTVESSAARAAGETPDDFVFRPERPLRAPAAASRLAAPRFPSKETPDDFVFVPPAAAAWPRQSQSLPGVAAAVTRP